VFGSHGKNLKRFPADFAEKDQEKKRVPADLGGKNFLADCADNAEKRKRKKQILLYST
jgi:hypothetical protein